jgi:ribulose-phosphate 3-epimerase
MEIIPTVVPVSLADIEKAIAMYAPFARTLHIDFADGVFAPNTTWMPGINAGSSRARIEGMAWEAHLMVEGAFPLGIACIEAGASRVIGHIEAIDGKTHKVLNAWRAAGAEEVGLGILFETPLEKLEPYIDECDVVQMMTIEKIGVQGLPFAAAAPLRLAQMHAKYPALAISVDGSVNEITLPQLASAGASRFCAGSVLSRSADPASTYRSLLALAEKSAIH